MVIALIVSIVIAQAFGAEWQAHNFPESTAMFSEDLGKIAKVTGKLKITAAITYSESRDDINLLKGMTNNFTSTCNNIPYTDVSRNFCTPLAEDAQRAARRTEAKINQAMTNPLRSKRETRSHNLFYDTLHYFFGLDNEAYQAIDDLIDNQDGLKEALNSNKKMMLQITRNTTTQINKIVDSYSNNFKQLQKATEALDKRQLMLHAHTMIKSIIADLTEKYEGRHLSQNIPNLNEAGHQTSKQHTSHEEWRNDTLLLSNEHVIYSSMMFSGYKLNYLPQRQKDDSWLVIDHFANIIIVGTKSYALLTDGEFSHCLEEAVGLHICLVQAEKSLTDQKAASSIWYAEGPNLTIARPRRRR